MSSLFDLFSNDDAEKAAAQRNAGLQSGLEALQGYYSQGQNAINTGYGNASNLYGNLAASTGAGANAYGDASGANGAAGLQRATQNFQSSPLYGAYGFSLNQGLQALDRTHAAAGNLNSGNADTDTLNYATGLAGQQYNNYLQGLNPYLGANANAVAGQANAATGQANALNSSYQALGNADNATQTGIGASNAAATLNNYNIGANDLNAISGILGGLTGSGGGGSGGGSAFSNIGSSLGKIGSSLFSAFL